MPTNLDGPQTDFRWAQPRAIADRLAATLQEWLTPHEWQEMRMKNATEAYGGGCCASHDYCDANTAMASAFVAITGRDVNGDSEDDAKLWSAAWDIAKREHLTGATS